MMGTGGWRLQRGGRDAGAVRLDRCRRRRRRWHCPCNIATGPALPSPLLLPIIAVQARRQREDPRRSRCGVSAIRHCPVAAPGRVRGDRPKPRRVGMSKVKQCVPSPAVCTYIHPNALGIRDKGAAMADEEGGGKCGRSWGEGGASIRYAPWLTMETQTQEGPPVKRKTRWRRGGRASPPTSTPKAGGELSLPPQLPLRRVSPTPPSGGRPRPPRESRCGRAVAAVAARVAQLGWQRPVLDAGDARRVEHRRQCLARRRKRRAAGAGRVDWVDEGDELATRGQQASHRRRPCGAEV